LGLLKARVGDRAAKMEVETNRFSADMLFPRPYFRKDLARMRIVDVGHIVTLAERYDMSIESTARSYVEEHDEPAAAVVSQHGKRSASTGTSLSRLSNAVTARRSLLLRQPLRRRLKRAKLRAGSKSTVAFGSHRTGVAARRSSTSKYLVSKLGFG
jgi:Zn-dependent peptidase ImmA (M78 family)